MIASRDAEVTVDAEALHFVFALELHIERKGELSPVDADGVRQHTYDYSEGGCRQVKDADVYFLYNVRQQKRNLRFTLRAEGDPETWEEIEVTFKPTRNANQESFLKISARIADGATPGPSLAGKEFQRHGQLTGVVLCRMHFVPS